MPLEDRRAIFIAGDDSRAKEIVARLIEEIGFAAVDTGFLHEGGRSQQPGTAVYNNDVTAYDKTLSNVIWTISIIAFVGSTLSRPLITARPTLHGP